MRVDVSFKNLEKSEFLNNVLAHDLEKIEKRVKIFRKDSPVHIAVRLEKSLHREEYTCSAHMYLPQHVLRADEKKDSASLAINKTFAALTKQLDKLKYKIEKHLQKKHLSS
ncbi:MAG: HPF/RaiA family ribosome-associated protein [Candidatus Omnitrophota bacterium]|nr:HPF/RaiA family ribosome-associated protein [Candidatus Omnitrophota bacterium]